MSILYDLIYNMKTELGEADDYHIKIFCENDLEVTIGTKDKISCVDNVLKIVKQNNTVCLVCLDKVILVSEREKEWL